MHANPSSSDPSASPTSIPSPNTHPLAKFKKRSHDTHHDIHLPELNVRLGLCLQPTPPAPISSTDGDAAYPKLQNTQPIQVVYLGNSMLERFTTTGRRSQLGKLCQSGVAFNAGVGGDKNESVLYRLDQGLYSILKGSNEKSNGRCDIKLWILCSGTNNLHPKRGFNDRDVESWKALLTACLSIAPHSTVLACDVLYRKDVPDDVTERANDMLKQAIADRVERESIVWVEARHAIGKEMLVDHVHLEEKGYAVWDGVLWPYVERVLRKAEDGTREGLKQTTEAGERPH